MGNKKHFVVFCYFNALYTDLGLGFRDQIYLRKCKNLTNKKAEQALTSHDTVECFNITSVNLGEPFYKAHQN